MAAGSGAMIDITVKTLDGQNRTFTVPENLNVRQFKEKISGSIEISADTQRLIFQGRVMQDEKILKDYDIHGKVIHLVQRAPPTSLSGSGTSSSSTTSTGSPGRHHGPMGNLFDVQIHLGRVQNNPTSREARARIRQAEFNLSLINDILSLLEQGPVVNAGDGPNTEGSEASRSCTASRSRAAGEGQTEDSMDTASPPGADLTNQPENAGTGSRQQQTRSGANQSGAEDAQGGLLATELADFLDRVLSTNNRIAPHIRRYRDYLRNQENYPASSREGRDAQDVVSRVSEVLHAVGHMMHSLSDVVVDMNTNIPRQAVASAPTPFSIPGSHNVAIPIHMNVRSRQNGNGGGQRQNQASSTTTTGSSAPVSSTGMAASTQSIGTPANNAAANSSNAGHPSGAPGPAAFQMPPVSVPLSTAGDPTVMVEVFPTGVTVHDIRAVVTPGAGDEDSESSNDSNDGLARNTANITIRSSATIEQPISSTSTAASSSSPTTITSASAQPPTASSGITSSTTFSSSTSSTSSFTFSPTTSVNIGGMPNIGLGSVPNVPGLPPGLLQNILGSILNTHGVRAGHPVQVNVVQQMTASGGVGPHSHPPRPPPHRERQQQQQPVQDLPVDHDRGQGTPARLDTSLQTAANMEAATGTHQHAATNTSCSITNAATNTTNSSNTVGTNTGGSSANVATNTSGDGGITSTNVATNSSGSTTFTSTINLGRASQGSSIGTRTDPNMGTNSRSTNTPRPHFHIHQAPPGPRGPPSMHARPQMPGSVRPGGPGPGGRGYVDPYLPCSSPHYSTQTAMAAFRAIRNQMMARGQTMQQQQLQQQVPNLSTMVSGMVGDIIEQVGQAAHQALGTGSGPTSATTSTNTASSATTAPSAASAANSGAGGSNGEGSSHTRPPAINPMEMFASMFSGPSGAGGQVGPIPFDIGAMIGNIMQMRNPAGPNVSNTANTAASAAPTSSSSSSSSSSSTTTAPTGATLADLFTQFRTATEGGGDGDAAEVNVIVSLLEAVAPHMGLTDLFSLVMGNTRVLSQLRGPLREFVNSRVAQHGSVSQVVEVALSDMFPEIQHIESLVEVREGLDMARSIRNCLQSHLTTIFTAINSDSTGAQEEFGRHLYSLWMKMMAETIGLCVYCIRDGQAGFSNMVQRYMPRMTQGMNPAITIWMTTSLQDILGSFHRNHPVPESDILGYVVRKPARPVEVVGCGVEAAATTCSSSHVSAPATATTGASSSPSRTAGETSTPAPMDVSESPSAEAPRAKVARTLPDEETESPDIFEDAQESLSARAGAGTRPNTITASRTAADRDGAGTRPNTITASRTAADSDGAVGSAGPVRNGRGSDDWQTVIPQEWIPVISRDLDRQQTQRPQQPFSDAYLQGLPAKRRRMMNLEHAGEMGNMPQYFPASLTRAARAAGVEPISSEENLTQEAADNLDLQAELEREMVSVLESRITSDQDFNSDRFPNSKEYFHKSKRH